MNRMWTASKNCVWSISCSLTMILRQCNLPSTRLMIECGAIKLPRKKHVSLSCLLPLQMRSAKLEQTTQTNPK